jgi:hypothetical protein
LKTKINSNSKDAGPAEPWLTLIYFLRGSLRCISFADFTVFIKPENSTAKKAEFFAKGAKNPMTYLFSSERFALYFLRGLCRIY